MSSRVKVEPSLVSVKSEASTAATATASASSTAVKSEASSGTAADPSVDMLHSARAVWLVRVPEFVMEAWRQQPGDSTLGELRVHAGGSMSLLLKNPRVDDASAAAIPEHYSMSYDAKPTPMELFSETAEGEFAFEGLVEQRCDVTPVINEQYGRLMAERRSAAVQDAKRPRVMLDVEKRIVGVGLTKARRTQMEQASLISTKARTNKDRNRIQMPQHELVAKILALFEKTPELPIADIDHECQQPMNYLKDVLGTVAEFVRARKVWMLKPEYRHNDANSSSTSNKRGADLITDDDAEVE